MPRFTSLVCLAVAILMAGVAWADTEGFCPIFNGKNLDGWDGDPRLWRVEDGMIVGQTTAEKPTKGNTFLIWRGGQPADFELKIEFRMPEEGFANSGIHYRSAEKPEQWGRWVVGGYQADLASNPKYAGLIYEERGRGIIVQRGEKVSIGADHKSQVVGSVGDPAELLAKVKPHDWNEYHIIARGNRIQQIINGHVMTELIDDDPEMRRLEGLLALQLHVGPPMVVQFRNIRLKELPKQTTSADGNGKKIVFVAGRPSHGYGGHEHYAGCVLLAKCLKQGIPNVETAVCQNGWPSEARVFDGADAIVIFSDGGKGHPMLAHLDQVERLMKKGVGLACLHYAVEIPKGPAGDRLKGWLGGYFETHWSVNPFWTANFTQLPNHPIARGVKPFALEDEWYYHMRFVDGMAGVTPILSAVPPDATRERPDGPHSNNPTVRSRKGLPEILAWAYERSEDGRSFGFTGGHYHWSWANDSFRTVVLNGIAWTANIEIPQEGIFSKRPSLESLEAGQDEPQPKDYDRSKVMRTMEEWKQ